MPVRTKSALTKARLRSAITNGKFVLTDCDHRSAWMRRLRDLISSHLSDLGGESNTSHAEQVLIRRASMLTLQIEMMETAWVANDGEATSQQIENYQRTVNTLRRLLETLGLQRRSKNVTPSLSDYLAAKTREAAE